MPFQKVIGSLRAAYTAVVAASKRYGGEGCTLPRGVRLSDGGEGVGWGEGEDKVGKRAHEYRWQVRVVLDDQPPSCTRLIYYPRLWLWGIGFVGGPAEGANRKLY